MLFTGAIVKHFPDIMTNVNANHSNDNQQKEETMTEPKMNPMQALSAAMEAQAKAVATMLECVKTHDQVLRDHEARLDNLENIMGE